MQLILRLLLLQGVLVELVGRSKEHPVGLGDRLVGGRMAPRNEIEICLYELIDSRLP